MKITLSILTPPLLLWFTSLIFLYSALAFSSIENQDVDQYLENAIATLKLKLHKAAQRHEGRRKRSLAASQSDISNKELVLSSIQPICRIKSSQPVALQPFKIGINYYIAVVNYGVNTPSEIYHMRHNGSLALVQTFHGPVFIDFQYLDFGKEKFAAFMQNNRKGWNGKTSYDALVHFFKYFPTADSNSTFHFAFHIEAQGGTRVKGFIHNEKQYFIVANSKNTKGKTCTYSILYVRTPRGLLNVQTFETQGAEDVEVFVANGIVYLIFANHQDSRGMVDIYSKVYREKSSAGSVLYISFEYVQSILTHGARDVEHFKIKKHHYIVIANEYSQLISYETDETTKSKSRIILNDYEVDSIIYWWSGSLFVEWQRIPTSGAMKWDAFNGPGGEQFLVVANSKSQAVIYIYDHCIGLFKPTNLQGISPFPNSNHLPDVRSVKAFSFYGKTYLAVANFNESGGYNIFKLNFKYADLPNAGPTVHDQLSASLNEVVTKLGQVKDLHSKLKSYLNKIMTLRDRQQAFGNFSFKKVTIKKLKIEGNLIYKKASNTNPIQDAVQDAMGLQDLLLNQTTSIRELKRRLEDSVSSSTSSQIIGEKTFTGNVTFRNATVEDMKAGTINGVNLTDLRHRVWSKSRPQVITGKNVFLKDVKVLGNMAVGGTTNGIRIPENVVTTTTDQRIRGRKVFAQPVELHGNMVTINTTINGLRIPDDLVLRDSHQAILGRKIFNSTINLAKSIIVNGTTNGKDLSEFSKRVVTLSTDQVITGKKTFTKGFDVEGNLDVSGLVDGVNLTELDLDAARINQKEVIRGKKIIIGSVEVAQNVVTCSTTNGVLLQDDVMTTTSNQVINGKKTFIDLNVQGDVITTSTINGIDLSEEAVTKSRDHTILGRKTFMNDVIVNGNIDVNGTVDGVNISQFIKSVMRVNGENIITAPKTFTGTVSVGNISVRGTINGVDLTELRNSIWTLDGSHVITAPMSFENLVVKSNLNVSGTINGVRMTIDFNPFKDIQKTYKDVVFEDDVVFQGGIEFGENSSLNGEHFPSFLKNVVLNRTTQTIRGRLYFNNGLSIKSGINVNGTINGYNVPGDFVTLDTEQNITGIKTFLNGVTINGTLHTGIINVSSTVNGVDISELRENAVFKGRNQTISGNIIFNNSVSVLGPLKVGGLIDGINITELAETVVSLSRSQNISGTKVFLKDVELNSPLTSPGFINCVNLSELQLSSLKKSGDQYVSGTKVFEKLVYIQGNLVNGTINGIDLGKLKRSVVTKNNTETINGDVTFTQNVSCRKLSITGTIDGVLLQDMLLTFGDQVIEGKKVFKGDLVFKKNLLVDKLINGVDINALQRDVMKIYEDQNSTATLIFANGFHVNGSIFLEGLVNGVDVSEINSNAVRINGTETIHGKKTFSKNIIISGDLTLKEKLNGINITNLLSDVMSISKKQEITGRKTFAARNGIRVTKGLRTDNIIVKGLVDGVNITDLHRTAVTLGSDQNLEGEYTFMNDTVFNGNVDIKGLLNDVSLCSDVLLTYSDQNVTGFYKFMNLVANKDINITGNVDGVDISEFASSRVTLSTDQTIYGQLSFASDVIVRGSTKLPNKATVNNIDVSEELLCLDDKLLLINGTKTFTKELVIDGDLHVTGLVQGLNISELAMKIARTDNIKELTGRNTFARNLTVNGNMICLGYINGIKIKQLIADAEKFKEATLRALAFLRRTIHPICRKVKVLLSLNGLEKRIDGMEHEHEIALPQGGHVDTIIIGNEVFIAVARPVFSGCGNAYILCCDFKLSCKIHQQFRTQAIFVQFFKESSDFFVFIGHYGKTSNGCPSYPEILKYDAAKGLFTSQYNITSSVYKTQKNLSLSDTVVQNLAALIPPALLGSPVQPSPVDAIGSLKKSIPALTRVFVANGTTYLVRAHARTNVYGIDVFIIDRKTLAARRLQRIGTRGVLTIDIGQLEGRVLLAVAENRPPGNDMVRLYSFIEERKSFFYYKRIHVAALAIQFTNILNKYYFIFANPNSGFGLCPWKGVMCFDECMRVQDYGIHYISQVTTPDGVFVVGVTNTNIVIYKIFIRGMAPKYSGTLNCSQ